MKFQKNLKSNKKVEEIKENEIIEKYDNEFLYLKYLYINLFIRYKIY